MAPQEQKNRLNDIMFHAQRCELYDDEHRLYAKMGLGITIYFYGGGSESGQRKVLDSVCRTVEYGSRSTMTGKRYIWKRESPFPMCPSLKIYWRRLCGD